MTFSQLLRILRARWKLMTGVFVTVVALALTVSLLLPKSYTATTELVVNGKAQDPVTGAAQPVELQSGYLATQVDIINSRNVTDRVIDRLQLDRVPAVQERFRKATGGRGSVKVWLANALQRNLEVRPAHDSNVLAVSYSGEDPEFAALLANTFAESYIQASLEMHTQPAKQVSGWFDQQLKGLKEDLEVAQHKLSAYQQTSGIVATDERMDEENARLTELSSLLVTAQGQRVDAQSREDQLRSQQKDAIPDILSNPLIQNLKAELSKAEGALAQLSERVGVNHPQYIQAKSEVDSLRARLDAEIRVAGNSIESNARINRQREGELRAALEAQKAKVLQLKKRRDEVAVLSQNVESAQRAYDAALLRASQSRLQSQLNQTDIYVLNPASPPNGPTSPRVLLNTVIAAFLGLLLGAGAALLREMVQRRIRSEDDLRLTLGVPVLVSLQSADTMVRRSGLIPRRLSF